MCASRPRESMRMLRKMERELCTRLAAVAHPHGYGVLLTAAAGTRSGTRCTTHSSSRTSAPSSAPNRSWKPCSLSVTRPCTLEDPRRRKRRTPRSAPRLAMRAFSCSSSNVRFFMVAVLAYDSLFDQRHPVRHARARQTIEQRIQRKSLTPSDHHICLSPRLETRSSARMGRWHREQDETYVVTIRTMSRLGTSRTSRTGRAPRFAPRPLSL
jgi:hypothetical protein